MGCICEIADIRNTAQPINHRKTKIWALKTRVGIKHHWERYAMRDRLKITINILIGNWKVRFKNSEDTVAAQLFYFVCLEYSIGDRGCRHPSDDRNAAACGVDYNFDNAAALGPAEIRDFTGQSQGSQSVHTGNNKIIAQAIQNLVHNLARGNNWRDEVRENAVECCVRHRETRPPNKSTHSNIQLFGPAT